MSSKKAILTLFVIWALVTLVYSAAIWGPVPRFLRREKPSSPSKPIEVPMDTGQIEGVVISENASAGTVRPLPKDAADPIKRLREYCRARHLHFQIRCEDWLPDPIKFCATAWHYGDDDTAIYIEDGAKPSWFVDEAPNQRAAALQLLQLLHENPESPNMHPSHDPRVMRHEPCPPEIRD